MSNYEPFFSLKRPLFDSDGGRGFVYESDQLKNAADSFKSAFSKPRPLLFVGGQHGCGKSSTVHFALDQLGEKTHRISVGRVRLSEDEVIDLLLDKLGVEDVSGGTIKKLGRFAKRVEELRSGGERVVVIVEDAIRTGANILSELDVLCGGDGGTDVGLVICGDENLRALLKTPELAPLNQRMNDFVRLAPFAVDELEDYLRHAVSEAGGDYDSIFGKDFAGLTHILSCGVPRVANKLTEACLAAAAKAGSRKVSCALLADIAKSRFDIEIELPVHRTTPEAPKHEPVAAAPPKAPPMAPPKAPPEVPSKAPPKAQPEAPPKAPPMAPPKPPPEVPPKAPATKAAQVSAPKFAPREPKSQQIPDVSALTGDRAPDRKQTPDKTADVEIPHLIQDTQPELKALSADHATHDQPDEADTSGAFVSLPNLEDLTAEFAAVSQMIESLPTSRYDDEEESSEIKDAFSDFGALDNPQETSGFDEPETTVDETPAVDRTSTALPKLSIPEDPTLNEAATGNIDAPVKRAPTVEATPETEPKITGDPAQSASEQPVPEVPVLQVEQAEPAAAAPEPRKDPTPKVASAPKKSAEPEASPKTTKNAEIENKPTPGVTSDKARAAIEAEQLKDWDKDPTLAELRPDLDALELAMGEDIELASEPVPTPVEKPKPEVVQAPAAMPEITLDSSIKEKVEEAAAENNAKPEQSKETGSGGPTDTEVHRMMEDLSKSNSLEDMDDRLAETLFGDEINLVASQVLKAARESMDKKNSEAPMELSLERTSENPIPAAPHAAKKVEQQKPEIVPDAFSEDEGEVIDLKSMPPNSGLDMSATQRLRTVRALNAGRGPGAKAPPPAQRPKAPAAPEEKPVPIEDQIDLSMTATFKALKIDPNALQQEEEETEKKGFFSRFRKKG